MGTRRRCISRSSSDVSNGVARARVVRNGIDLVLSDARTDLGRPRIVQECKGKWAHEPARLGFRPAGWPLR